MVVAADIVENIVMRIVSQLRNGAQELDAEIRVTLHDPALLQRQGSRLL